MATTQAHAFLGVEGISHTFRFNPDAVNWGYQENVTSQDTIGGRVVQLLSVQVQDITVEGRAGSRGELQRLAENVRDIMAFHVRTSRPVSFRVPSRNWNFIVYVKAMPQIGWDVSSTSYPYSLQLAVVEDLTGIKSQQLELAVLRRLTKDIGYQEEFHGGDVKGFQKIVNSVLKVAPASLSLGPGETDRNLNLPGSATREIQEIIGMAKRVPGWTLGRICGADTLAGEATSEHFYCNAADLDVPGTDETGSALGMTVGTGLAGFLVESGRTGLLPINCVIFWERIAQRPNFSWEPYGGDNLHRGHVHVSAWPSVGGAC